MHQVGLARINPRIVESMRAVIDKAGFTPIPIEFPNEELTGTLSVVILSTIMPTGKTHERGQLRSCGEYFQRVYEIVRRQSPNARVVLTTENHTIQWLKPIMRLKCPECTLVTVENQTLLGDNLSQPDTIPVIRHEDIRLRDGKPVNSTSFACAAEILQALARYSQVAGR